MDEFTMMSRTKNIREAFEERPELEQGILSAINQDRQLGELFDGIAAYTINQRNIIKELTNNSKTAAGTAGNQAKKRKLDDGDENLAQDPGLWADGPYSTFKELAFTIPQRKKLTLEIGNQILGLRARLPATNAVEFGIKWSQIQQIICLPVPDKPQPQFAFCIFPTQNLGITAGPGAADAPDQISFTVPNTKAKPGSFSDDVKFASDESIKAVLIRTLNEGLLWGAKVIEPAENEFFSKVPPALRKEEKAVHVKAHQGSKEGFLFFLSIGIVWAFKKPLCFFAFDAVDSISYSSIVQRTFNLNIDTHATEAQNKSKTFEFSHIDIVEYEGIDEYIGRHGLKDASMTEQRRAKDLNYNGRNGAKDAVKEDSPGELEKATMEAENIAADEDHDDEEEEDDENFDPGSEGESEGEGASEEDEGSD